MIGLFPARFPRNRRGKEKHGRSERSEKIYDYAKNTAKNTANERGKLANFPRLCYDKYSDFRSKFKKYVVWKKKGEKQ